MYVRTGMAETIDMAYGETLARRFTGLESLDPEHDKLLFAVRDKDGSPLYADALDVGDGYADLVIAHADSEEMLPVGEYEYGVAVYRDAVMGDCYPTDGVVTAAIRYAPFTVDRSVAREDGLVCRAGKKPMLMRPAVSGVLAGAGEDEGYSASTAMRPRW